MLIEFRWFDEGEGEYGIKAENSRLIFCCKKIKNHKTKYILRQAISGYDSWVETSDKLGKTILTKEVTGKIEEQLYSRIKEFEFLFNNGRDRIDS